MKQFSWECAYCRQEHTHSIRPIKCSCRSGYVKHIKRGIADKTGDSDG